MEPSPLLTLTIRAAGERASSGSIVVVTLITPNTLVSNTSRTAGSSTLPGLWAARSPEMPALLTRMYSRPKRSSIQRAADRTLARSVTSRLTGYNRRPRSAAAGAPRASPGHRVHPRAQVRSGCRTAVRVARGQQDVRAERGEPGCALAPDALVGTGDQGSCGFCHAFSPPRGRPGVPTPIRYAAIPCGYGKTGGPRARLLHRCRRRTRLRAGGRPAWDDPPAARPRHSAARTTAGRSPVGTWQPPRRPDPAG